MPESAIPLSEKEFIQLSMEDPLNLPTERETLFLPQDRFPKDSEIPEVLTFHVEKSNAQNHKKLPWNKKSLAGKSKIKRKTEYGYDMKNQFLQNVEAMRPSLHALRKRDGPWKKLFRSNAIEHDGIPALDNQVKNKFVQSVKWNMDNLKKKVMAKMEKKALKQKAEAKKSAKAAKNGTKAKVVSGPGKTLTQLLQQEHLDWPATEMVQDQVEELQAENQLLKAQNSKKWKLEKQMLGQMSNLR